MWCSVEQYSVLCVCVCVCVWDVHILLFVVQDQSPDISNKYFACQICLTEENEDQEIPSE
jgi:hypothetical protein